MVAIVVSGVVALLMLVAICGLSMTLMRKIGVITPGQKAPALRPLFWAWMGAALVIGAFELWAFSTRHGAVGVAVLFAFFVLPEFVLIPLRIRRSRRAA